MSGSTFGQAASNGDAKLTDVASTLLGHPCRNFNILGMVNFLDPKDGREKVVFSSFAAGSTGKLVFVDVESGEGEALTLPGDEGAWALYNLDDQRLLVGTCARSGYLHALELADRQWLEPLRDPKGNETYIWNLCRGTDGRVYGGTYNGCVLLQYDPAVHTLENVGRTSPNPKNLYSRNVYSEIPGKILVYSGMAEEHLSLYDIAHGEFERFGPANAKVKQISPEYLWVESGSEIVCYSTQTLAEISLANAPLPEPSVKPYGGSWQQTSLTDGRICATRGQEYYIFSSAVTYAKSAEDVVGGVSPLPPLRTIPTERPPTRVHTLIADAEGKLWGASGFGQTIFSYDPNRDAMWNSQVVCESGGEVYGMAFIGPRLFVSAYAGGDHIVYDPRAPWDQVANVNPRTLQSVAPAYIRPEARSVQGPDGHFWTGWMARYGRYGGAITRVHSETLAVTVWEELVPGQAVMTIGADDRYLYFATGGAANGLAAKDEEFSFCVLSTEGKVLHQYRFALGRHPHRIVVLPPQAEAASTARARVMVAVDDELWRFDAEQFAWQEAVAIGTRIDCLLPLATGELLIFAGEQVWHYAASQAGVLGATVLGTLPGPVYTATQTPDGKVYFAVKTGVYQLEL